MKPNQLYFIYVLIVIGQVHSEMNESACWSLGEFLNLQTDAAMFCFNVPVPEVLPSNITSLFLGGKVLTTIEANTFKDNSFRSLQILTIRKTMIQEISENAFESLNLKELHLISNPTNMIKRNWFMNKTDLEHLEISLSLIRAISSDSFPELEGLIKLNLSGNHIQTIESESFKNLKGLENLDLSRNRLRVLTDGVYSDLELRWLDISQNPWHCTCDLMGFVQWLRMFTSGYENRSLSNDLLTMCATPAHTAGTVLTNVSDDICSATTITANPGTRRTTSEEMNGITLGVTTGAILIFLVMLLLGASMLWFTYGKSKTTVQPTPKTTDKMDIHTAGNQNQKASFCSREPNSTGTKSASHAFQIENPENDLGCSIINKEGDLEIYDL